MNNVFNKNFSSGIDQYAIPRQEGDIDLIAVVRQLLIENGLGANIQEVYDNHIHILEGNNKNPNVQKYLLNRYFMTQLMIYAHKSSEQRFCLIPNGTPQQWLELFKSSVIPFLIENNLPVKV